MDTYNGPFYYHQLGDKDQKRCLAMLKMGHGDGAILSPRDLRTGTLLADYADQCRATEKVLLIDPQQYDPSKVQEQAGGPAHTTRDLLDPNLIAPFVRRGLQPQRQLGASQYLIPCIYTQSLSDDWLNILSKSSLIASEWVSELEQPKPLLATVAIHLSEIANEQNRRKLLNTVVRLRVDGFYVVIADVDTTTSDATFLSGLLELVFRLKWQGFRVLLGYSGPWAMLGSVDILT